MAWAVEALPDGRFHAVIWDQALRVPGSPTIPDDAIESRCFDSAAEAKNWCRDNEPDFIMISRRVRRTLAGFGDWPQPKPEHEGEADG